MPVFCQAMTAAVCDRDRSSCREPAPSAAAARRDRPDSRLRPHISARVRSSRLCRSRHPPNVPSYLMRPSNSARCRYSRRRSRASYCRSGDGILIARTGGDRDSPGDSDARHRGSGPACGSDPCHWPNGDGRSAGTPGDKTVCRAAPRSRATCRRCRRTPPPTRVRSGVVRARRPARRSRSRRCGRCGDAPSLVATDVLRRRVTWTSPDRAPTPASVHAAADVRVTMPSPCRCATARHRTAWRCLGVSGVCRL